jgi:DNA-binding NarL/FixJ family response regulator
MLCKYVLPGAKQMATRSPRLDEKIFWLQEPELDPAVRELFLSAAEGAWSYAQRMAWSYLNDDSLAADLLERALSVVSRNVASANPLPTKSYIQGYLCNQVRRIAKQEANRNKRQEYVGSLGDLEMLATPRARAAEEEVFLQQLLSHFSPQAQRIALAIRAGYTWREIAEQFDTEHSVVRRAFRVEADRALQKVGRIAPSRC